jgi:hypothetical protein
MSVLNRRIRRPRAAQSAPVPGSPHRRRPLFAGVAVLVSAALLWPAGASAHGLIQRANLPIPEWLFGWAAAIVLIVSFAALAVLWPKPRLEGANGWRPLPGPFATFFAGRGVEIACGAIGIFFLAVTIVSGLFGAQEALANFAPTFVFITFWVGMVLASVLFGNVYAAFNPWRAMGRVLFRGEAHKPYPERLGRWPAAIGLFAFTWLELASQGWSQKPGLLAILIISYTVVQLWGMAVYGVETWLSNAEAFAVYFGFFARISPFRQRDGKVGVRPPLSGLTTLKRPPGTVAVVCVMIGTVTFDGLSQGALWKDIGPALVDAFTSLGAGLDAAAKLADTVGLLGGVCLVAAFYALGIEGAKSVGGGLTAARLRMIFVHTLVPIACVYALAHYLTYLLYEGQAIQYLASDPFGQGWDLFGTASAAIDFSLLSENATWYLQFGLVTAGHVAALMLAHDRALVTYGQASQAVRSQYWMLGIMVGFTLLALWLLRQAGS